jgi:hypothetical protein
MTGTARLVPLLSFLTCQQPQPPLVLPLVGPTTCIARRSTISRLRWKFCTHRRPSPSRPIAGPTAATRRAIPTPTTIRRRERLCRSRRCLPRQRPSNKDSKPRGRCAGDHQVRGTWRGRSTWVCDRTQSVGQQSRGGARSHCADRQFVARGFLEKGRGALWRSAHQDDFQRIRRPSRRTQ